MLRLKLALCVCMGAAGVAGLALSSSPTAGTATTSPASALGRRAALRGLGGLGLALAGGAASPALAAEEPAEEKLLGVYFGCGCFWHVQHEFVEAERRILGRKDPQLTSYAGYAGGTGACGKVCYHNAAGVGDYGKLGHAEVVALQIPEASFSSFADEYFRLFDDGGNRADQFGDRGTEYRNLVGLPGGTKSPLLSLLQDAATARGNSMAVSEGRGFDADARGKVWVVDSDKFPFYIAEPYHQFHDGFKLGENYPDQYNALARQKLTAKQFSDSGCPNGLLGVGIGGL